VGAEQQACGATGVGRNAAVGMKYAPKANAVAALKTR